MLEIMLNFKVNNLHDKHFQSVKRGMTPFANSCLDSNSMCTSDMVLMSDSC